MHPTVLTIRQKYPHAGKYPDSPYCVGGALCLWLAGVAALPRFPPHAELCGILRFAANLPEYAAYHYAAAIITYNDQGRIEEAWNALGDAFAFEGTWNALDRALSVLPYSFTLLP